MVFLKIMNWELFLYFVSSLSFGCLWYLFFKFSREYVLLCFLFRVNLLVSFWLYVLNSCFLGFALYMAIISGVLVLICYCIALVPFDLLKKDREEDVNKGRFFSLLNIFLFLIFLFLLILFFNWVYWCIVGKLPANVDFLLQVVKSWEWIPASHWSLCVSYFWCYIMMFLSFHLFLVMVGRIGMLDFCSGSLVRFR